MAEILPLVPSVPYYRFATALDGNPYVIDVRWNGRTQAWYMDVLATDETPIARGLKLVIGAFIGIRSAHPDMPGIFAVRDTSKQERDAGFDDIGFDANGNQLRVQVYFFTYSEVAANG